jgi:O-antigen/teichoic acid export membrane protein
VKGTSSASSGSRWLGRSTVVSAAFIVSGLTSYVTLVLAKRSLTADDFGAFSIFWSLGFLLASLSCSPVEQEISRSVAVQLERRIAPAVDLRHGALTLALAAVAAVVVGGVLLRLEVVGSGVPTGLLAAVGALVVGEAVACLVRGEASARQDTRALSGIVAGHGLARGVAAILAAVAGWGLVATCSAVAAAGVVPILYVPRLVRRMDRPAGETPRGASPLEFSVPSTARLFVGTPPRSLFAIGTPVLAAIVATSSEQATIGDLLAALSLTSAPVLVAVALQAVLLPQYATWIERDDHARVHAMTRRLVSIVALGTAVATAAAALVGVPVLRLVFGGTPGIGALALALMTAGAGLLFMANVLTPVVIASRRYGTINGAWYAGALVTVATAFVPIALANAIGLAVAAGAAVVVFLLLAALWPVLRTEPQPTLSR